MDLYIIQLRNVVNTYIVKTAESKETGETNKARSLIHSALGFQSSLERLLADIGMMLNSLYFN